MNADPGRGEIRCRNPRVPGSQQRRPPSATTGRQHPEDVAGLELDRALVGEALGSGLIPAREQPVLPNRSGPSSCQTPRLRDASLRDQRHGGILENLEISLDTLAASGPPGTATASAQPVAQNPKRKGPLQRLDGGIPRVGQHC